MLKDYKIKIQVKETKIKTFLQKEIRQIIHLFILPTIQINLKLLILRNDYFLK